MEEISKQMFIERGLNSFDAFVLASKLKYSEEYSKQIASSIKIQTSRNNLQWIDRVFKECAILELLGPEKYANHERDQDLFALTNHADILKQIETDKLRLTELEQTVRKERTSGFLTCRKCKGTKVDVDQVQTRSADEPMTLFALCQDCGSRWTMK